MARSGVANRDAVEIFNAWRCIRQQLASDNHTHAGSLRHAGDFLQENYYLPACSSTLP